MNENEKYSFYDNINSSRNNKYYERHPSSFNQNSNKSSFYGKKHYNTTDYGPEPFVVDITEATKRNDTFRTALWTGNHLQLTLMSINVGEDIGFEIHHDLDQFIRVEEGQGIVLMGERKERMEFRANVYDDFAFIIPAGTWHNLINTGKKPLKVYSIYAPPQHPAGTIHQTKADAQKAEHENSKFF